MSGLAFLVARIVLMLQDTEIGCNQGGVIFGFNVLVAFDNHAGGVNDVGVAVRPHKFASHELFRSPSPIRLDRRMFGVAKQQKVELVVIHKARMLANRIFANTNNERVIQGNKVVSRITKAAGLSGAGRRVVFGIEIYNHPAASKVSQAAECAMLIGQGEVGCFSHGACVWYYLATVYSNSSPQAPDNKLQHIAEFRELLANYHIADEGREILGKSRLVLLFGPTASGRDTIMRALAKSGTYAVIVSDTTRHPRINNGILEQDGVEYWFRSESDMLADLRAGRMLEAEILFDQHVSGISLRELERAAAQQKIAVTDVEFNIEQIVKTKPDAQAFLIIPPDYEEWMRRLTGRGIMAHDERARRLATARDVLRAGLEWGFLTIIVNRQVEQVVAEINAIVAGGQLSASSQQANRTVLLTLLQQLDERLATT